MTDTIQLDRATAERILASLMGCDETTAGSYSYLLINICDLSHALAAQPVQPALTDAITLPRYLVREWEVRLRSNLLESFANELAHELRTGGAG